MLTRYQVALEAGGTLTAVRQNLETAAAEALEARGRTVNVAWRENQRTTYITRAGSPRLTAKGMANEGMGTWGRASRGRLRRGARCGLRLVRRRQHRQTWQWQRAASGLSAPQANTPVPASVGKGEGQLNLIAWEGYAQPQWVKPFEQATGCQVSAKYAGSSSEMVSLMANGVGGQYDMVSASGDADLRLIYSGDVKPININLVPQWKNFHPFLQNPPFNTIGGKHYGVSYEFGPNVLLYSKKTFPSAPTSWSCCTTRSTRAR